MKKINKYIIGLFAIASLASCKQELNLNPIYDNTTGTAYKKLDDFVAGLSGVYARFADVSYYNGNIGPLVEAPTDNVYETLESLVNFQRLSNWTYLSNEGYMANTWSAIYNGLYQINNMIERIGAFQSESATKYNRVYGQLLAARALMHFDLLKAWADNLDRNSTSAGIPIKTGTAITTPSRNTVKEVYDAIYADLNNAITALGNVDISINTASNKANIDINGARSILAKVALYAKDYPTAITQSTAVIAAVPLATRAQFPGIWNDANVNEVIWSVQNNVGDPGSPFPSADIMSFRFNRNTFGAHRLLLSLYDTTGYATGVLNSRDIRFPAYFFLRNTTAGVNNWAIQKFRGKGAASDNLVNYKVFRAAEMYLIRAEAYANTAGQDALGSTDLNTLKTARINGWVNVAYAGAALKNEIENERRRELVCEGHRWFDLKRTTRTVTRPTTGLGNPNAAIITTLGSGSNRWVWPVPEGETRANASMQQNPGY